ncbi:MAG TPA: thioredoxin family protein [Phycisphaerales bacterium]|nr:thioredoxin family protein [Phycisphaerales bacterium]HRQ76056.1 thioredoxin family protein [Phycisphaerales bacterium]
MLMNASFLKRFFDQGVPYEVFVASGEREGHRPQWDERYSRLELDAPQRALVASFTREMNILCLTGTWCGDCALQGAAMQRIAEANPAKINLRFIPRSEDHAELIVKNQINAGYRVPVTWFMAEDFEPISRLGDRTLSRYRSMARKALPEVETAALPPPPADPIREVLRETLDEFERVHLLLRTSTRLRQKHGD